MRQKVVGNEFGDEYTKEIMSFDTITLHCRGDEKSMKCFQLVDKLILTIDQFQAPCKVLGTLG